MNGGAWIETTVGKVDFLYRNIEQVERTVEKAISGIWETDYAQQPPHGFSSVIDLAEIACSIPVYDVENVISRLKAKVKDYPSALKEAVVQRSLWSAEFTIAHTDYLSREQDTYNTFGCLSSAMKNIVDTLFALNEVYLIGDKRAINVLENSSYCPAGFRGKIEQVFIAGGHPLTRNVAAMRTFFEEVVAMTQGVYKPLYPLRQ